MISLNDIYWAAGFLEGEGNFYGHSHSLTLSASQVQKEPLEKLLCLFGGKLRSCKRTNPPKWKNPYVWELPSNKSAGLTMTIYQLLSPARKVQAKRALDAWRSGKVSAKYRKSCVHGHPYSPSNTYLLKDGSRMCRKCMKVSRDRYLERKKRGSWQPSKSQLEFKYRLPGNISNE